MMVTAVMRNEDLRITQHDLVVTLPNQTHVIDEVTVTSHLLRSVMTATLITAMAVMTHVVLKRTISEIHLVPLYAKSEVIVLLMVQRNVMTVP